VGGVCLFPQAPLGFPFKKTTIIRKARSGVCLIPYFTYIPDTRQRKKYSFYL